MSEDRASAPKIRRPISATAAIALEFVSAAFGIVSGILLIAQPSGAGLGFPSDFKEKIPTGNFFLVGVWLSIVFGMLPAVFGYGLATRRRWGLAERFTRWTNLHWAWVGAVAICVLEVAFIGVEIPLIGLFGVTTNWAFVQAIMIAVLILPSVRKYYRLP